MVCIVFLLLAQFDEKTKASVLLSFDQEERREDISCAVDIFVLRRLCPF